MPNVIGARDTGNILQARRVIFENQSETAGNRSERYANIKSSIY